MRKSVKVLIAAAVTVAAIAVPVVIISGQANAAACNTVSTNLVNRPDSGGHGDWATDNITRKVVICEGSSAGEGTSNYHATVTDNGTFVTIAGHSPQAGVPIAAGITGTVTGGFTADFTAPAGFAGYKGNGNGVTYSGTAPSPTSTWVAWVYGIMTPATGDSFINDDWTWTYKSCSESWTDAANNQDGSLPADGDITGKACPSHSPSPSHSATPTPSPTGTSTTPPPAPAPIPVTGNLPVTG